MPNVSGFSEEVNATVSIHPQKNNPVWVPPWGYRESFLVAGGLLVIGFALEWVTPGQSLSAPSWPVNGIIGAVLFLIPLLLHLLAPANHVVQWMGRIPASMGAIVALTIVVLLMGLVLQGQPSGIGWVDRLGLSHLVRSWPFLLTIFWFLMVLGMATVRRSIPFRTRNTGFILNHLGLWIVIAGGVLGSGDLRRVTMELHPNQTVWYGHDRQGQHVELPLALELQRFHMEEYPPKMGMVDLPTERLVILNEQDLVEIETGRQGEMGGWSYEIIQFYSDSRRVSDRFEPIFDVGAAPSALVHAVHKSRPDTVKGWITCGSFNMEHQFLHLSEDRALAMTVPQSRRYMSVARLFTESGKNTVIDIEVNQPYSAGGWKLYQFSYDDRFGKWSPASIIEAVRDPWLPFVYAGFVMMILGAGYIFWVGHLKGENI